jgi:hypothetical protein
MHTSTSGISSLTPLLSLVYVQLLGKRKRKANNESTLNNSDKTSSQRNKKAKTKTRGRPPTKNVDDDAFTTFVNDTYRELVKTKVIHAADIGTDAEFDDLWCSLPDDDAFELLHDFTNEDWLDPNMIKHKRPNLPYQECVSGEEQQAFLQCYLNQKAETYPGLMCTEVEKLGHTLHTNSTTTFQAGCVIVPYIGEVFPEAFIPESHWTETGCADKILSYIPVDETKCSSSRDILVSPGKKGGIAQFALTAAPSNRDFLNVNCALIGKRVKFHCGKVRIIYYLVALKEIPPHTALVWFYGFEYDFSRLERWLKCNEIQHALEEQLLENESKSSAAAKTTLEI